MFPPGDAFFWKNGGLPAHNDPRCSRFLRAHLKDKGNAACVSLEFDITAGPCPWRIKRSGSSRRRRNRRRRNRRRRRRERKAKKDDGGGVYVCVKSREGITVKSVDFRKLFFFPVSTDSPVLSWQRSGVDNNSRVCTDTNLPFVEASLGGQTRLVSRCFSSLCRGQKTGGIEKVQNE